MINNLLGVLIGAEIDRDDGGSGLEGAVEGYLVEGAIKAVAPMLVTFAIGWTVQFLARRAWQSATAARQGT